MNEPLADERQPVGKLIRGEGGAFRYDFGDVDIRAVYALPPGEHDLFVARRSPAAVPAISDEQIVEAKELACLLENYQRYEGGMTEHEFNRCAVLLREFAALRSRLAGGAIPASSTDGGVREGGNG